MTTITASKLVLRILADLERDGYALVEGALTAAQTSAARDRLLTAASDDEANGNAYTYDGSPGSGPDGTYQRVWALLNRGQEFIDLATHPMAVAVCEAVLGRPFLLSNISANITGPGGSRMHVHADQGYVADPWPPFPLAVNCAWLLTDFTAANGATRVVTGSHRLNRNPTPDELSRLQNDDTRSKPIEGPAGSMLVIDSRAWHQTGNNTTTDERRCGIFPYYVKPWLRTQENWFRSLDPRVEATMSTELRSMLGFDHFRSLGIVNGMPLDQPRF